MPKIYETKCKWNTNYQVVEKPKMKSTNERKFFYYKIKENLMWNF